ncbi:nuclear pore complex protein Nup98-Nup96-like isoform X2 [Branchiostoma lanceolatum]|uniref:nuclear pore complex protein Nup98-Nup96-like isoform X2 n=1 Tax=Branchiostoma lanceolatum TaxID=7740 RepID=UPI0034552C6B
MFGAPQKTPFGGTTGFGTTAKPFGAAKTTGTGAFGTSSFGATQTPATGGLFGGTSTNTGTGLFGGTSFGTPSTSTSTFGGFGGTSTTQTGGGLFGTSTSTAGTGLFATPQQQTAPFGAANKTGFGGFGTQTSTAATGTGLFGATQQTPSLFGGGQTSSTGLFGAVGSIGAGTNGTTVKFNPVSGSDTMMKNGVSQNIRTAHQCITAMKEYETKSLEELRVEDYLANRKGGSTGTTALFGATATPQTGGGLFGTATTTSTTGFTFGKAAFGTGQTQAKGATGFGTTSTGTGLFGQTQTTQAGGLFASPFGGTATTTTASTGFSFGQTNTGTGLFGQTQQKTGLFGQPTTQTTGLFGTPSTTTATGFGSTFGTGTFGTPNQAGGLFGANKAPTFGATTTTSTTGGLFGNTATNTGGLFGQSKPGLTLGLGTGFGTGAFGTTTTSTGTSLFGQKPTNTFGAGLGTGLGAGLGTLGTASIFGNTGLGTGLGTGTTGLNLTQPTTLGTDAAAQLAQQAQIQQQLQALANSPFGDSPLFRNNVADPAKRAELLKPTSLAAQKALTTPSHYKISPRPTAKIKPKPLHSLVSGKSQLFEGLDDEDTSLSNDTFVPRRSVKKLIIRNKASPTASELDAGLGEEDDLLAPPAYPSDTFLVEDKRTSESEKENDPMENLYSNPVRKPIPETPANKSSPAPDDSIIALNLRQRSCSPGEDSMGEPTHDEGEAEEDVEREPHPAGIVLTKNEYYTEPSLDELANMVDENGDCWVENFVIGRDGYGSVFFPGLTNVANLNLDETVHIRRKEITVYPDDSTKPPEGEGLNKKAEVTLHCTWPMDKTAHIPIKSPDRLKKMGYQEKIEVATSKIGARFLEYRPDTGSWVFQVPHFSKYGLDDSEDEEELVSQDQKKMKMQQQGDLQKQQQKENQPPSLNSQPPITETLKAEQPIMEQMQDDSDMADISQEPIPDLAPNSSGDQDGLEGLSEEEVVPSSHRLATHLGMSAHRMQVMKASFFGDEEEGEGMDYKPVFGGMSGKSSLRGSAPPSGSASPLPHRMVESKMDRGSFLAHTARLGSLGSPVRGLGGMSMSPSHSPRTRIPSGGFSPKFSPKVEQSGLFPSMSRPAPYPVFERNQGLLLPSGLSSEMERPRKIVGSQRQPMLLPWKETVTNEKQSLVADAALMMGRSFKVGWGPNWTLVRCAGPDKDGEAPERKKETSIPFSILPKSTPRLAKLGTSSPFSVVMERVDVAPHFVVQDKVTVANHVAHLEVELETSLCSTEDHPCPVFVPTPGVGALHQHAEVAGRNKENCGVRHPERESADHANLVLSLCVALWGDLPDQDREDGENGLDRTSYAYHMARREAVSHWLMNQAQDTIQQEVQDSKFKEGGHTDAIFSLLSGRQISQACSLAQQSGDHRLALILAQAGGSHFPREVLGKQLSDWEELKADRFISDSRLRVYALLAGKPVWPATNGEINTCENLDWKRALAVHLWYLCTPSATVPEALHLYLQAFTKKSEFGEYANPPLPPYLERSSYRSGDQEEDRYVIRDMCYHLLQLYADRSHQLDRLLAPTTSTPNQLDYRLSWLVCQVLQALDYTHLSEHHLNTIHAGYIAQLESLGLWEWAVFVALHITDNSRRELVTKELLCRHCSLSEEEAYVQKEEFLQEKLKVPAVWIHEAKALRAHYEGKPHDEAWHLLKAGKWNASHRIILKHLAADAIINEDYEYLQELLEELSPPERSSTIQDWNFGGRVFLDYIHINNTLIEMAKGVSSSYDLERLHPQVTSLCSRVENIPCLTPKDRLCQSEMAKKAASFLRLVLEGQNKPPTVDGECLVPSYQLAPHITKLPMPEDYALQELRALTHSYMVELTT